MHKREHNAAVKQSVWRHSSRYIIMCKKQGDEKSLNHSMYESGIVYILFAPTCIKYSERAMEGPETLPSLTPALEGGWVLGAEVERDFLLYTL